MKIMIVDDSKFGRGMVRNYVKAIFPEAEFIPAKNGIEALDIYQNHLNDERIDLVFLDYLMPEIDGLAVAQQIMNKDKEAFIVMITSNLQDPVRVNALGQGIKFFFNKPVKKSDLMEVKQLWEMASQK